MSESRWMILYYLDERAGRHVPIHEACDDRAAGLAQASTPHVLRGNEWLYPWHMVMSIQVVEGRELCCLCRHWESWAKDHGQPAVGYCDKDDDAKPWWANCRHWEA